MKTTRVLYNAVNNHVLVTEALQLHDPTLVELSIATSLRCSDTGLTVIQGFVD